MLWKGVKMKNNLSEWSIREWNAWFAILNILESLIILYINIMIIGKLFYILCL